MRIRFRMFTGLLVAVASITTAGQLYAKTARQVSTLKVRPAAVVPTSYHGDAGSVGMDCTSCDTTSSGRGGGWAFGNANCGCGAGGGGDWATSDCSCGGGTGGGGLGGGGFWGGNRSDCMACQMPMHYPHDSAYHGYYYFRPYNYVHIRQHQNAASRWGGDPRNPYSNTIFQGIYNDLGLAEETMSAPSTIEHRIETIQPSPFHDEPGPPPAESARSRARRSASTNRMSSFFTIPESETEEAHEETSRIAPIKNVSRQAESDESETRVTRVRFIDGK